MCLRSPRLRPMASILSITRLASVSKSVSNSVNSVPSSSRKACTWPPLLWSMLKTPGAISITQDLPQDQKASGQGKPSRAYSRPRGEGVLGIAERRQKLGEVPQQDARHVVVVDPVEPGLGVDPRGVVRREEIGRASCRERV